MLPADPLRGQEARQKQVVIGHRGRWATDCCPLPSFASYIRHECN